MDDTQDLKIRRKKRTVVRRKTRNSRRGTKRNAKRKLIAFLFVIACAAIIFVALKAPFFNITAVECVGQQNLTQEEILSTAQINTGANIFSTNIQAAKKRLEEKPEIEWVKIKRVFPNKVRIEVAEARILAYADHDGHFLLVDRYGKIIKSFDNTAVQETEGLAKLQGISMVSSQPGTSIAAEDDLRASVMFECIGILESTGLLEKVNLIDFADLSDIKIDYENRLGILLGSYDNMDYKLKFIQKTKSDYLSGSERACLDFRAKNLVATERAVFEKALDPEGYAKQQESEITETAEESTENKDTTQETAQ